MADHNATKTLDLKGLPCPMPVVKMSQEIGSVKVGEVIECTPPIRVLCPTSPLGERPRETRCWKLGKVTCHPNFRQTAQINRTRDCHDRQTLLLHYCADGLPRFRWFIVVASSRSRAF